MHAEQEHRLPTPKTRDEVSIMNNLQTQSDSVGSRTAAHWVGFFLPHLRTGMCQLAGGRGVGTITLDLAENRLSRPGRR